MGTVSTRLLDEQACERLSTPEPFVAVQTACVIEKPVEVSHSQRMGCLTQCLGLYIINESIFLLMFLLNHSHTH